MTESYRSLEEEIPKLPEDPNEAGEALQGLWKTQKASETPWSELTEEEQKRKMELEQQKRTLEPKFKWLAEIYGSEIGWGQGRLETNYGKAFYFQFGYGDSSEAPDVFVFYSDQDTYTDGTVISRGRDGWENKTIEEFKNDHMKRYEELM